MAANSRTSTGLLIPKKRNYGRDLPTSPDRTRIWIEPKSKSTAPDCKVAVIYYISRNGHLQHPHFMEVSLSSSSQGLYLRDVMNRLNFLRGNGMTNLYSWSSKRSYKNGYVWHDLSENDLIHPTNGHDEYVLKGSELLRSSPSFRSYETASSRNVLPEANDSGNDCNLPASIRRRNQSWSSFDNPQEYGVYKSESSRDFSTAAADAATQTEEKRRGRGSGSGSGKGERREHGINAVELSREEISPPPSNCSSEVLEGVSGSRDVDQDKRISDRTVKYGQRLSGRMKTSKVLMQLISCGSVIPGKDLGSMRNQDV